MVAHNRISAVVCSADLERSREFYEQKVGLTLSAETIPNHLLFEGGDGTTLLVYGRPSPNLADHTQVRVWCPDVAADVSELVGRGVEFDLVEFGDFKMVDHVLTTPVGRSAWFKDPDGNTIALFQPALRRRCAADVGRPPSPAAGVSPGAKGSRPAYGSAGYSALIVRCTRNARDPRLSPGSLLLRNRSASTSMRRRRLSEYCPQRSRSE